MSAAAVETDSSACCLPSYNRGPMRRGTSAPGLCARVCTRGCSSENAAVAVNVNGSTAKRTTERDTRACRGLVQERSSRAVVGCRLHWLRWLYRGAFGRETLLGQASHSDRLAGARLPRPAAILDAARTDQREHTLGRPVPSREQQRHAACTQQLSAQETRPHPRRDYGPRWIFNWRRTRRLFR